MKTYEKLIIEVEVFNEESDSPIPFKKIKDVIEDDDKIIAGYEEGCHTEDWSHDGYHYMVVLRTRLETDEEFNKRIARTELINQKLKDDRYQTYLKLKKEFETTN